jgi:hypothetical protein
VYSSRPWSHRAQTVGSLRGQERRPRGRRLHDRYRDRALVIHARVVHEALIGKFLEKERAALLQTLSRSGYWPLLAALQTRPRQQVVDTGGQLAWPLWTPRHDLCDTCLHRTVADSASLDRTPPATAWGPSVGSNGEQSVADARRLQTARRPWRGVTDMGDAVRAVNPPRDRRSRPAAGSENRPGAYWVARA